MGREHATQDGEDRLAVSFRRGGVKTFVVRQSGHDESLRAFAAGFDSRV
jgi:hypothetical protein